MINKNNMLANKTKKFYGNDYRSHPEWQNAKSYALNRAQNSTEILYKMLVERQISEETYLSQSNNYILAFYNDEDWHHTYMVQKALEDSFQKKE